MSQKYRLHQKNVYESTKVCGVVCELSNEDHSRKKVVSA